MASALGVTEPYSAGIGGGGYFVYYDATTGRVETLDGRETAPAAMPKDAFIDPETGEALPVHPGPGHQWRLRRDPGHPGHLGDAPWTDGARWSLRKALQPSIDLARRGASSSTTRSASRRRTTRSASRRSRRPASSTCPVARPRRSGPRSATPTSPTPYAEIAQKGTKAAFYRGKLAREIASAVQEPPTAPDNTLPVPPGYLTPKDLKRYRLSSRRRPRSTTAGTTSTAWRRPPAAARPSVRPSTSSRPRTSPPWTTARRCTTTSRRARSRSRTAAPTSGTRRTSTCRSTTCSATPSRRSVPARSSRPS